MFIGKISIMFFSSIVTAWMNSSGHKANILNSSFNYTGIEVVKSSKYGKVYV